MYTGNQNRGREEMNLEKLLQVTSDNPQVFTGKKTPTGPGSANHLDVRTQDPGMNFQSFGGSYATDYYSNLNNAGGYGGGMQDVSSQRGAGGTGGGSEDTEGNMDANQLLTLNPYLSKNVTSFNDGGMFGEFAKYNHGGTVGSMTIDNERPAGFTGGPGGQHNDGQYVPHQPGSSAYKAYVDQGVIPTGNTTFNPYTGQYSRAVKQRYDNGGMMPQQRQSYSEQANDMIALAQLEAFGKKFLSQTQGQVPQANQGMKMKRYTQGGRF